MIINSISRPKNVLWWVEYRVSMFSTSCNISIKSNCSAELAGNWSWMFRIILNWFPIWGRCVSSLFSTKYHLLSSCMSNVHSLDKLLFILGGQTLDSKCITIHIYFSSLQVYKCQSLCVSRKILWCLLSNRSDGGGLGPTKDNRVSFLIFVTFLSQFFSLSIISEI